MLQAILPACVLLATSSIQDSDHLVDGMIERSNGLKSFAATYRVHGRSMDAEHKEYEGDLRLVYRAPEELSVEWKHAEHGMRMVAANGTASIDLRRDGRIVQRGEIEGDVSLSEARARIGRNFHEQFPSLGDVAGSEGPGVFVRFSIKPGTDSERPGFNVEAGMDRGENALLGWLDLIRLSKGALASEDDAVVWEPAEGIRVFLRRDTGFIEKVVVNYRGETKTRLKLTNLAIDGEVDDAEFRFSEVDPSAEDISESLGRSWEVNRFLTLRGLVRRRIRDGLEAETLEWTSDTRARWGTVLRAFHGEFAPLLSGDWADGVRSRVDEFCVWYQESKKLIPEGDVDRADELEDTRIEWEARLRENIDRWVEPYLARAVPDVEEASAFPIAGEARALELEVAEAAFRRSVVEPLLEHFAEQMERARRGELPPAKH